MIREDNMSSIVWHRLCNESVKPRNRNRVFRTAWNRHSSGSALFVELSSFEMGVVSL
jgi:hypothetical protein